MNASTVVIQAPLFNEVKTWITYSNAPIIIEPSDETLNKGAQVVRNEANGGLKTVVFSVAEKLVIDSDQDENGILQ